MSGLVTAIPTAAVAFSATNLDDLVILMLFFSQIRETLPCDGGVSDFVSTFRPRHILAGQYLGFSALVVASLPGFFGGLIVPRPWIGLLGLIPIVIGLECLLNRDDSLEIELETERASGSFLASFLAPQTYTVATITFANGGDNIGVYVPLFASSTWQSLLVTLGVFFLLIGVWCYAAYRLTHQQQLAEILARYSNTIVPCVLLGLGVLILLESRTLEDRTLTIVTELLSYFSLVNLSKNNDHSPKGTKN